MNFGLANAGAMNFAMPPMGGALAPSAALTEEDNRYRATIKELRELYVAYTDKVPPNTAIPNEECRFKAVVFVDKSPTKDQPQRPSHMKDTEDSKHADMWKAAQTKLIERGMADTIQPKVIFGVQNLVNQTRMHEGKIFAGHGFKEYAKRAASIRGHREDMSARQEERLARIRQKHAALMEDLLEIMERFELLQHLHKPLTDDERELHSRVESLSVHLRRSNAVLSDLSAANAQSGRQVAQLQNMDQTGDQVKIDLALQGQRQALEKLVVHHNKDLRDIKIMMDHWGM
jgi:hypothetical protein